MKKIPLVRKLTNKWLKVTLWLIGLALLVMYAMDEYGLIPLLVFLLLTTIGAGFGFAILFRLMSKSEDFEISLSKTDHFSVAIPLAVIAGFFLAHQANLMPSLMPSPIMDMTFMEKTFPEVLFYFMGLILFSLGYWRGYVIEPRRLKK